MDAVGDGMANLVLLAMAFMGVYSTVNTVLEARCIDQAVRVLAAARQ
jgi:predicted amidohydrolase